MTAGGATSDSPTLAPDLDQRAPTKIGVLAETVKGQVVHRLAFESKVDNVGRGPLVVRGRRPTVEREMRADQVLVRRDGTRWTRPFVGKLRFVESPDHRHWHYLGFERYELRRAADYELVGPDRKTGFCLGDRYNANSAGRQPGEPAKGRYRTRCGLNRPDLTSIREGISVGWGDDYPPHLEGQFIEVTTLPAGRYVLVHRVNKDKVLRETSYANNASSALVELRWSRSGPRRATARTLAVCPGSDRCA